MGSTAAISDCSVVVPRSLRSPLFSRTAHEIVARSLRASSPIWASEASLSRTRERAAKPRGAGEGPPRSPVLARLTSLAQIGELARRLRATISCAVHDEMTRQHDEMTRQHDEITRRHFEINLTRQRVDSMNWRDETRTLRHDYAARRDEHFVLELTP